MRIHVYTHKIFADYVGFFFLDLEKTLTTEYLWNIIKVIFIEINYSCSETGLSIVESAVWKGGAGRRHRGHLTATWPRIWDKGFLRMLQRMLLEQTV